MLLTSFFICLLAQNSPQPFGKGSGYKRIHRRYPWISISTIRYTIKKEYERYAGVSKPRSSRPKKLDKTDKVRLLDAIKENPRVTYEDLLAEVSYKRPYLTKENALKRLQWAVRYQHFTPEDWARVFWSDKWLILLFGDLESQCRGMNRFVIRDLYLRILRILVLNEGSIFQHNNAPTYTVHIIRDALRDMNIEVMDWPPHSPDLNPIENLWALLKAEIYKLRPDLIHMRNND
ncbi:uncharacterized protein N7518_007641 [Penicillium psychrosexuale]|uniref:uncharacterized protein n=1 Tax=Penicillium psychrosexuale TaxID=1002107 RepID=UPI002544E83A|nr:uncharacterized protein N7518_007641 [Penicillium psychrosexuale]KAJ5790630.1 hypothetical protein N7518_007641 [Penicillium psychrosexuale]